MNAGPLYLIAALIAFAGCQDTRSTPDHDGAIGGSAIDSGPSSGGGSSAAWRPFSASSPWNAPIPDGAPLRPDSSVLIAHLAESASPPSLSVSISPWSVPMYAVDGSVPTVEVRAALSNEGESMTFRWPVPAGATPAPERDAHMLLVDRAAGRGYDFWHAARQGDGSWDCGLCATTDLNGTGVRPPKGGSAPWYASHGSRACGFPLSAGLITVEEMRAGRIEHALVLAYPALRQRWFVSPASTGHPANGRINDTEGIPCGGRIQLDPSLDVDRLGLSDGGRVIARALQQYGAYVGDFSGSINLYADGSTEAQASWSAGLLTMGATTPLSLSSLRVIEWGELTPDG